MSVRWSSWWSMPSRRHRRSTSSVQGIAKIEPTSPLDDYGSMALSGEGAEMESADRSFLEYGLAADVNATVLHANASTMTNSDSCHDWTGDHPIG